MGCAHWGAARPQRRGSGNGPVVGWVHRWSVRSGVWGRGRAGCSGGAGGLADAAGCSGSGSTLRDDCARAAWWRGMGRCAAADVSPSDITRPCGTAARAGITLCETPDRLVRRLRRDQRDHTMFPLAIIQAFNVSAGAPASTYAFAAAASLGCYPLAASAAAQHGPLPVLRAGFAARTTAIAIIGAAFLLPAGGLPIALFGFVVLILAWPMLGVAGTALTAELAPGEKGEALGLFNASSSFAGAVGALLGGCGMEQVGFGAMCVAAALTVATTGLCTVSRKARH